MVDAIDTPPRKPARVRPLGVAAGVGIVLLLHAFVFLLFGKEVVLVIGLIQLPFLAMFWGYLSFLGRKSKALGVAIAGAVTLPLYGVYCSTGGL